MQTFYVVPFEDEELSHNVETHVLETPLKNFDGVKINSKGLSSLKYEDLIKQFPKAKYFRLWKEETDTESESGFECQPLSTERLKKSIHLGVFNQNQFRAAVDRQTLFGVPAFQGFQKNLANIRVVITNETTPLEWIENQLPVTDSLKNLVNQINDHSRTKLLSQEDEVIVANCPNLTRRACMVLPSDSSTPWLKQALQHINSFSRGVINDLYYWTTDDHRWTLHRRTFQARPAFITNIQNREGEALLTFSQDIEVLVSDNDSTIEDLEKLISKFYTSQEVKILAVSEQSETIKVISELIFRTKISDIPTSNEAHRIFPLWEKLRSASIKMVDIISKQTAAAAPLEDWGTPVSNEHWETLEPDWEENDEEMNAIKKQSLIEHAEEEKRKAEKAITVHIPIEPEPFLPIKLQCLHLANVLEGFEWKVKRFKLFKQMPRGVIKMIDELKKFAHSKSNVTEEKVIILLKAIASSRERNAPKENSKHRIRYQTTTRFYSAFSDPEHPCKSLQDVEALLNRMNDAHHEEANSLSRPGK